MDLGQVRDAVLGVAPSAGRAFQSVTGISPGKVVGEVRKAGQILKAHPAGAVLTDLVFPEPMADGTLDAAVKKGAIGRYEQGY